jgi:hypothetical protein
MTEVITMLFTTLVQSTEISEPIIHMLIKLVEYGQPIL